MAELSEEKEVRKIDAKPLKSGSSLEKFVPFLVVLTIGLAFLVGVLWQKANLLGTTVKNPTPTGNTQVNPPRDLSGKLSADQVKKFPPITESDHIKGSKDAKIVLIEYFDLQCPYCKDFHPIIKQAVEEYGNDIAWVVRNYPLYSIHPKAESSAIAAECVANIGGSDAYWNFVDLVLSGQPSSLDKLASIAGQVGVNSSKFNSCIKAQTYKSKVDNDYSGGVSAGITGTPANIILNQKGEGWLIPGYVSYDQLKATIEEALKN